LYEEPVRPQFGKRNGLFPDRQHNLLANIRAHMVRQSARDQRIDGEKVGMFSARLDKVGVLEGCTGNLWLRRTALRN
jgi:hypothetical protein